MISISRFVCSLLLSAATPALSQDDETRVIEGFSDFRQEVTSILSGATQRLWIVTDYLTDGDIVSALYIAKYRKIDVAVLLGRAKANAYMSRLSYLKAQNIPVFLKPDKWKLRAQTAILADDSLFFAEGDLDFLTRVKEFKTHAASDIEKDAFVTAFTEAITLKLPATARQIPLVGRQPRMHPQPGVRLAPPKPHEPKTPDPLGVYHYKRTADPRPADVPSRLPKGLKWDNQAAREKPMMITPVLPVPRPDGG